MGSRAIVYETEGSVQTPSAFRGPAKGPAAARVRTIRRGAMAVLNGRIETMGPRARVRATHRGARIVNLGDSLVIPGLVDAHNHLPFAGSRAFELDLKLQGVSYLDILAKGGGIHHTVRATRRATLPDLVRLCLGRLDEMLASGTTTSEAKSGYGLRWKDERKQLLAVRRAAATHPVRLVPTFLGAHIVPKGAQRGRYVRQVTNTMIPQVARQKLARFCDVFMERNAFTAAETRRILLAADAAGLGKKLHADEFSNGGGARLGAQMGCTSVDHLMKIDAPGIRAVARSDTIAVLLPFVHRASFESRTAPARRLIDAGAAVALGTDFNPNCHNLSMLEAFRAAVYDLRLRPAEAFTAATVNSAHALGLGGQVGALAPGFLADFLVVKAGNVTELAYRQGENPIRAAYVGGRQAFERRG